MSLQDAPGGERTHIGFFGRRNVGKSSVVNAVTEQEMSIVSDTPGTTTDPVSKAMELLPLGPVLLIDTPGLDDVGELGRKRTGRAWRALAHTDIAVLVMDASADADRREEEMLQALLAQRIPLVIAWNKADLVGRDSAAQAAFQARRRAFLSAVLSSEKEDTGERIAETILSAKTGEGADSLRMTLAAVGKRQERRLPLASDLLSAGGLAVLVIPIDAAAPKGRIILPQQQVLRDLLETGHPVLSVRPEELSAVLPFSDLRPELVITDSQVFREVAELIPEELPLTSFSILMARYKGTLEAQIRGIRAIDALRDGDRVLIAEGCSHRRTCEDIGSVKIPAWLARHTGRKLVIDTTAGKDYPADLTPYKLVIHCGGCMLNEREMQYRLREAEAAGVPFANYGMVIARTQGILARSLKPLYRDREPEQDAELLRRCARGTEQDAQKGTGEEKTNDLEPEKN